MRSVLYLSSMARTSEASSGKSFTLAQASSDGGWNRTIEEYLLDHSLKQRPFIQKSLILAHESLLELRVSDAHYFLLSFCAFIYPL